jgi:galactose mutarotase-like enzyme
MQFFRKEVKGEKCVFMESDTLIIGVLPSFGAKIVSIFYKPQNFEVLFQNQSPLYKHPEYGAIFANFDVSGADDMFPTIDPCRYPYEGFFGTPCPDHGELWTLPWNVALTDNTIACEAKGEKFPYRFRREISLTEDSVRIDYLVENTGYYPLYGLWAYHGLVNCDEDTLIELPEVRGVYIAHDSKNYGPAGSVIPFPFYSPMPGRKINVGQVLPSTANTTEKFYVNGKVPRGEASLLLNHKKLRYTLRFPYVKIPYLGVWINQGGFKGGYNIALEPSNGFYDSLEFAKMMGSLTPIAPGQTRQWWLEIDLSEIKEKK